MTTAYERILDKLEGVKRNGNKANARWPAHPDRNTSLSLRAIEGSVLLWCFVCEDNDKVLAALKSTSADLYDNRRGATYQYEDGRNVHRTHVNGTKDFPQTGNTSGQPTLYRLSKVKEAVKRGDAILLVEGDKDVHALESIGVTATTAPMGAGNIDKCDLSPLNGGLVTAIVDKPKDDNDTTGEQWARHLRRALTDKANIEFKQAKVGKDAADHIAAQFGVEDFVPYVFPVNPLLAGKRNAVWLKQQRFDPL